MKINELMQKLLQIQAEHGDIDVMFAESAGDICGIEYVVSRTAEEDEFDPEWQMPAGFTFVEIGR